MGVLAAVVLIPATESLQKARWQRDRAIAVERHRQERITRYEEYLAALDEQNPSLVLSLAESQLNEIPADRTVMHSATGGPLGSRSQDLSVFPGLEPPPIQLPEFHPVESTLSHLVTSPKTRGWMILGGAVCVLVGLLPASRGWSRRHPAGGTPLHH
jgi:hypothetical protein